MDPSACLTSISMPRLPLNNCYDNEAESIASCGVSVGEGTEGICEVSERVVLPKLVNRETNVSEKFQSRKRKCSEREDEDTVLDDEHFVEKKGQVIDSEIFYRPSKLVPVGTSDNSMLATINVNKKKEMEVVRTFSKMYGMSSVEALKDYSHERERKRSTEKCLFDFLHESLLYEVLCKLSLPNLLVAQLSCKSWHQIVSSCNVFHRIYDEKNRENKDLWLALSCSVRHNNKKYFSCFTDCFSLFKLSARDGCLIAKQYNFAQLFDDLICIDNSEWSLKQAIEGLFLFASKNGKLALIQPLTSHIKVLPSATTACKISLQTYLSKSFRCLRILMAGNCHNRGLRVVIIAETKRFNLEAIVYNSLTDSWKVNKITGADISLFKKHLVKSSFWGNIIWCSINYHDLFGYDVETGLLSRWIMSTDYAHTSFFRVLSVFVYRKKPFLLCGWSNYNHGRFIELCVLEAKLQEKRWEVFMKATLAGALRISITPSALTSYDGNDSVIVLPKSGSRMLMLDLGTKSGKILDCNPVSSVNDSRCLNTFSGLRKAESVYHLKLKFQTAI
eukprot:TRINITY_DN8158_c0_g1_i1.p1 TRINITY_DN8158_c0_g1~~TRINITY_DN8158_c0_g1_i1.p1  ORF type:complete len:560 (+),score=91.19 TRINITY_DN8158_c0_g1_i1:1325-3004(+)